MSKYVITICRSVLEDRMVNITGALLFLDHKVETLQLDIVSISDHFYPEIVAYKTKTGPIIARTIVYESSTPVIC